MIPPFTNPPANQSEAYVQELFHDIFYHSCLDPTQGSSLYLIIDLEENSEGYIYNFGNWTHPIVFRVLCDQGSQNLSDITVVEAANQL